MGASLQPMLGLCTRRARGCGESKADGGSGDERGGGAETGEFERRYRYGIMKTRMYF